MRVPRLNTQQRAAAQAITQWCEARGIKLACRRLRHVFPRCYVLGPGLVAFPMADAEPQIKALYAGSKKKPMTIPTEMDDSLKKGDWCMTAYVSTPNWGGCVAIPIAALGGVDERS